MSRRNEIYVSGDVFKSLLLLAKAQSGDIEAERRVTSDEIADQILRQAIREQHPQLLEYQKKLDKLEQETVESLRQK